MANDPYELKSGYDDLANKSIIAEMKVELQRLRDKYKDDDSVVNSARSRVKNVKLKQVFQLDADEPASDVKGEIVKGLRGSAISVDGAAVLKRATSKQLDPAYKPMTIGGWCKPSSVNGVIVAHGGVSHGYSLYLDDGVPVFAVRTSNQLSKARARKPIELDEWSHVAAILYAEGRVQIVVNGKPMRRARKSAFVTNSPADGLSVGADTGSFVGEYEDENAFSGLLEDVRVYWGVLDEKKLAEWAAQDNE